MHHSVEKTDGELTNPHSSPGARPGWFRFWARPASSGMTTSSAASTSASPSPSSSSPITNGNSSTSASSSSSSSSSSSNGLNGSGLAGSDSNGANALHASRMPEGGGLPAAHLWQKRLQQQMEGWRKDPQWADVPPKIEVTVPKDAFIHVDCSSVLALPPDAVFDTLCDPANARVFKNIKGVLQRRVLEDDGLRQVVELEQAALWRFLFLSGTFSVHLRVVQDRGNYTLSFSLLKPGFMKQFRGLWKLVPVPVPPSSAMPEASASSHHHLLHHHLEYQHEHQHPHHHHRQHQYQHQHQHLRQDPKQLLDATFQHNAEHHLPLRFRHDYQPPVWHSQDHVHGESTNENLSSSDSSTSSSNRPSSGASTSTPLPGSTVSPQPWGLVQPRPVVLHQTDALNLGTSTPEGSKLSASEAGHKGPTVPWYGPETRVATYARLVQEVSPALVPPPWLAHYLRGISANTTWEVLRDLQIEAARLRYGLGEGSDMRWEMRRILARESVGEGEKGVRGVRGKEMGREGERERGWKRDGRRTQRRGRGERDARHGRRGAGARRAHEDQQRHDAKA